ncbi:MAG: chorismate mutase [Oscillospiraceae bacterium]|nr:chorismate mutase [Oscillospiraceae bacterium]
MTIQKIRAEIDTIDAEIIKLFEKRIALCGEIAEYKKENGLPIRDEKREKEKLRTIAELMPAGMRGYGASLYERIFRLSRLRQRLLNGENIVLIGMPGSGKTTVARALSESLGCESFDSDELIENNTDETIKDIFVRCGEEAFRKLESDALAGLCSRRGVVIATGGGCVTREVNYPIIKGCGTVVWLRRSLKSLSLEGRPLSQSRGLVELYSERKPLYEMLADCVVDNDSSVSETVERIIENV